MSEGTAFMLQGLRQNTLVAGKTTALRLFAEAGVVSKANYIDATILRPDGSRIAAGWSKTEHVPITNSSAGPRLVVQILGYLLPWVGTYYVSAKILDANRAILATYTLDRIELLPTKDLRLRRTRAESAGAHFKFVIDYACGSKMENSEMVERMRRAP